MPRTRPPYPPEFRREAIDLVRSSGEPIPRIAKDHGCTQTLRS
ncbi:MAG: transposase [Thermoleophilaceae bacterium]